MENILESDVVSKCAKDLILIFLSTFRDFFLFLFFCDIGNEANEIVLLLMVVDLI